jgi:hypothetical protein
MGISGAMFAMFKAPDNKSIIDHAAAMRRRKSRHLML